MIDVFYNDSTEYSNRMNPVGNWVEQNGILISKLKGISLEEGNDIAKTVMQEHIKNPKVEIFLRGENGDRSLEQMGLLNYISGSVKSGYIIAPSMTTYLNSEQLPSMLSSYMDINVKDRSILKKEAQKAKSEGRVEDAISANNGQNNKKTNNNIISGVMGSKSSVVANMTGHSTLTSTTRTITSLSNANNESLLAGNRALFTSLDVYHHIINIVTYMDKQTVETAIKTYGLHEPTVEETLTVLKRSSDIYFRDEEYYKRFIIPFLNKCSPVELAGICYSLDLYHIRQYNEDFMMYFFDKLTTKIEGEGVSIDDLNRVNELDQTLLIYIHSVFYTEFKGKGKDYEKLNNFGFLDGVMKTYDVLHEALQEFQLFIHAFMRVNLAPINSFRLEFLRRRAVGLSDTDSSAFSSDEYIQWKYKKYIVNDKTIALGSCLTYLASESIVHQLQRISKVMNIENKNLRRLAMKNEYLWTAFTPSFASKHYYASPVIQEGNVFEEAGLEIKGVHLKSSALPNAVRSKGDKLIVDILHGVTVGDLSLDWVLNVAIGIENDIINSLKAGNTEYLIKVNVNSPEAYSLPPERSNYSRHLMWKQVFAVKYGELPEPPYTMVGIPTKLANKTTMETWVNSIKHQDVQSNLRVWIAKNNKTSLPNIYFNADFIEDKGFPEEIIEFVDFKQIVLRLTIQLRTILETLGIVLVPDVMIKDQFTIRDQ